MVHLCNTKALPINLSRFLPSNFIIMLGMLSNPHSYNWRDQNMWIISDGSRNTKKVVDVLLNRVLYIIWEWFSLFSAKVRSM